MAEPALEADEFLWGLDLFNHGYYWEAHEAWEPAWRAAGPDDPRRLLVKGLILLAAAGVKIRQGKPGATARHAGRAAALFRAVEHRAPDLACAVGIAIADLAGHAREAAATVHVAPPPGTPGAVFGFLLGQTSRPGQTSGPGPARRPDRDVAAGEGRRSRPKP